MFTYLGYVAAAVLGVVVIVQRAELRRPRCNCANIQADLDTFMEILTTMPEPGAARPDGINDWRSRSVRPPGS